MGKLIMDDTYHGKEPTLTRNRVFRTLLPFRPFRTFFTPQETNRPRGSATPGPAACSTPGTCYDDASFILWLPSFPSC